MVPSAPWKQPSIALEAEALVGEGKRECHGNISASLKKCTAVSFGFTPKCVQWVTPQQQLNILFRGEKSVPEDNHLCLSLSGFNFLDAVTYKLILAIYDQGYTMPELIEF